MSQKNILYLLALFFLLVAIFFAIRINAEVDTENCMSEYNVNLPIVMYHNISKNPAMLGKFAITPEQFENDLKYISEKGYTSITMEELIDYVENGAPLPDKPIIITFDDGHESFYTYAYPLLQEYKMKAVLSVIGSYTDEFTKNDDHNVDYAHLNWNEINEMSDSGFVEIQNHTYNLHSKDSKRKGCAILKGENSESYKKELSADLERLQKEIILFTDKKPTTLTYPYGNFCNESEQVARELGFKACLTCYEKINYETDDNGEWLYSLGRYNREHGKSSEYYFTYRLKLD